MINIAIDGFAGCGKGTVSEGLAKHFGFLHLDTGAIFRSLAVAFNRLGIDNPTENDMEQNLEKFKVEIRFENGKQLMFLNSEDVTPFLRNNEIALLSSKISAFKQARHKYEEIARNFARNNNCVVDGRDITTVLLPNADVKIFLQADLEVRVKRRFEEMKLTKPNITLESIRQNVQERDFKDANKGVYSTRIVDDDIVIDNTHLSIEETNALAIKLVTEKLKEKNLL